MPPKAAPPPGGIAAAVQLAVLLGGAPPPEGGIAQPAQDAINQLLQNNVITAQDRIMIGPHLIGFPPGFMRAGGTAVPRPTTAGTPPIIIRLDCTLPPPFVAGASRGWGNTPQFTVDVHFPPEVYRAAFLCGGKFHGVARVILTGPWTKDPAWVDTPNVYRAAVAVVFRRCTAAQHLPLPDAVETVAAAHRAAAAGGVGPTDADLTAADLDYRMKWTFPTLLAGAPTTWICECDSQGIAPALPATTDAAPAHAAGVAAANVPQPSRFFSETRVPPNAEHLCYPALVPVSWDFTEQREDSTVMIHGSW